MSWTEDCFSPHKMAPGLAGVAVFWSSLPVRGWPSSRDDSFLEVGRAREAAFTAGWAESQSDRETRFGRHAVVRAGSLNFSSISGEEWTAQAETGECVPGRLGSGPRGRTCVLLLVLRWRSAAAHVLPHTCHSVGGNVTAESAEKPGKFSVSGLSGSIGHNNPQLKLHLDSAVSVFHVGMWVISSDFAHCEHKTCFPGAGEVTPLKNALWSCFNLELNTASLVASLNPWTFTVALKLKNKQNIFFIFFKLLLWLTRITLTCQFGS